MNNFKYLQKNSHLAWLSFISYTLTLAFSRLIVFLIEQDLDIPFLQYNIVKGYHIHHFTYGILILITVAFISIFLRVAKRSYWLYIFFGIALGLIFDEFGIWLKLDPQYNQLISYIAASIVGLILFLIALASKRFPSSFKQYYNDNILK